MFVAFKCQILCNGQCNLRRDQTLYNRVICQIHKHGNVLGGSALVESAAEEIRYVVLHAHGRKYDTELLVRIVAQGSLLYQLCRQLIMGQTVSGENRQLLSTNQSGQAINGGESGTP